MATFRWALSMDPEYVFWIFFAVWILLAVGSYVIFTRAPYDAKKRWYPFILAFGVVSSIGLGYLQNPSDYVTPLVFSAILIPAAFFFYKYSTFCSHCWSFVFPLPTDYCPTCGMKLDETAHS